MINFLTAEYSKIFKRKNIYIGLAFVTLASILNIIISIFTNPEYLSIGHVELQQLMLRFLGNKFVAIIMVFVITVGIAGSSGNSVKNAITIGYTRLQIYFSKLILGATIVTIMLFASMISTFVFTGIWLHDLLTIMEFWEALIRFALLYLVYITLYTISLTLCYVINYNMLFAIVYFILFLVFSEIMETVSEFSEVFNTIANLTLTHQLNGIILSSNKMYLWPYPLCTTIGYTALTLLFGSIVISQKDIR